MRYPHTNSIWGGAAAAASLFTLQVCVPAFGKKAAEAESGLCGIWSPAQVFIIQMSKTRQSDRAVCFGAQGSAAV